MVEMLIGGFLMAFGVILGAAVQKSSDEWQCSECEDDEL